MVAFALRQTTSGIIATSLGIALLLAAAAAAQGPRVMDAQSTTGPFPPPGSSAESTTPSPESAVVLAGVPAYTWHHGCGPTAAGMVVAYWDGRGFDLVPGDASTQTMEANAMMATEGPASNYWDYCLPMDDSSPTLLADRSEPPPGDEHANDSVADFMRTSQSAAANRYGWSWFSDVGPALTGYAGMVRPDIVVTTTDLYMDSSLTFDAYKAEIDAGRPVVFLVDSNADGWTDHFIAAVGYDDSAAPKYAYLNTWDMDLHWTDFGPMVPGIAWGIYGATTFEIEGAAQPVVLYRNTAVSSLSPLQPSLASIFTGTGPVTLAAADKYILGFVSGAPDPDAALLTDSNRRLAFYQVDADPAALRIEKHADGFLYFFY